jgi:hypothetical protein
MISTDRAKGDVKIMKAIAVGRYEIIWKVAPKRMGIINSGCSGNIKRIDKLDFALYYPQVKSIYYNIYVFLIAHMGGGGMSTLFHDDCLQHM